MEIKPETLKELEHKTFPCFCPLTTNDCINVTLVYYCASAAFRFRLWLEEMLNLRYWTWQSDVCFFLRSRLMCRTRCNLLFIAADFSFRWKWITWSVIVVRQNSHPVSSDILHISNDSLHVHLLMHLITEKL